MYDILMVIIISLVIYEVKKESILFAKCLTCIFMFMLTANLIYDMQTHQNKIKNEIASLKESINQKKKNILVTEKMLKESTETKTIIYVPKSLRVDKNIILDKEILLSSDAMLGASVYLKDLKREKLLKGSVISEKDGILSFAADKQIYTIMVYKKSNLGQHALMDLHNTMLKTALESDLKYDQERLNHLVSQKSWFNI